MESVTEVWKAVIGHEGHYEVSNLGRVRSLPRTIIRGNGSPHCSAGKMLSISIHRATGYSVVRIGDGPKYIHRLVLEAFAGPCPFGMEGCHDPDPAKTNNALANLRWDTPKSNQGDRVKHGTSNRGERCGSVKLTESQALAIMESLEPGCDLAKRYGVSQQAICCIRKGRNWAHLRQQVKP